MTTGRVDGLLLEKIVKVARERGLLADPGTAGESGRAAPEGREERDEGFCPPFPPEKVNRLLARVVGRLAEAGSEPETSPWERSDEMGRKPLLIQFTDILHACGDSEARPVQEFLVKHAADQTFVGRARVILNVYQMKKVYQQASLRGPADAR